MELKLVAVVEKQSLRVLFVASFTYYVHEDNLELDNEDFLNEIWDRTQQLFYD